MLLKNLLDSFFQLPENADRDIQSLVLDSRKVAKNAVFFALKGNASDGKHYIQEAISRGASAIIIETNEEEKWELHQDVPFLFIQHLPQKLGEVAARFYDFPAKKMQMIGVTGTNGKTSCTHFLAEVFTNLGKSTGLIGTLGSGFYQALHETGYTTPDAITLQKTLNDFQKQQADVVAMEVSSHSIHQGRVNGIDFDAGVFTNLTQDHLDYHGDMETYANVKRRFLAEFPVKNVIVNMDDAYGAKWSQIFQQRDVYAYALQRQTTKIPLTFADDIQLSRAGIRTNIHSPWGDASLYLPLLGAFNLSNALAALTTLCALQVPFEAVLAQLEKLHAVPGRMQVIKQEEKPLVIVDYAHTPDALEKTLQALRLHTQGKLICVFGCGGERDQGKRAKMGAIAERLADQVIVTNDNPRHEEDFMIAQQIFSGFQHPERIFLELNRSKAICNSIQLADKNDCILIAGKGAERYQQIGDEKFPFDDVEEVQKYFRI